MILDSCLMFVLIFRSSKMSKLNILSLTFVFYALGQNLSRTLISWHSFTHCTEKTQIWIAVLYSHGELSRLAFVCVQRCRRVMNRLLVPFERKRALAWWKSFGFMLLVFLLPHCGKCVWILLRRIRLCSWVVYGSGPRLNISSLPPHRRCWTSTCLSGHLLLIYTDLELGVYQTLKEPQGRAIWDLCPTRCFCCSFVSESA